MESLVMDNLSAYYTNKKVFVTGHTGFKGSWLCAWLHTMGATVKGYSLAPEGDDSFYSLLSGSININSVIDDIRNKQKMQDELLRFKPDIVFHLAAQPLVRRSYQIPSETFEVNVIGTTNLLEAASKLQNSCSIVIITTDKVYANREIDYHYKETDRLGGYDPYSASKAAAEIAVDSFCNSFFNAKEYEQHQKGVASARAGNVIGGGDFNQNRIIPDIVSALKNNQPVQVRNPFSVRPWQHVLEPLFGYLLLGKLLSENAITYAGAYNFGPSDEDHLTVKELVDIAISCWGNGAWENRYDASQPHEAGLLKLSNSKAINTLNWKPKLSCKQAIEWTIDWYKQSNKDVVKYTFQQIKNYQQK